MCQNDKPIPPETWECCGGGCSPCVWDHYYAALGRWQEKEGIIIKDVKSEDIIDTSEDHLFR